MIKKTPELEPHQKSLRKGRYDELGLYYFLTTVTKEREPLFSEPTMAMTVLNSLKWLDHNDKIELIAAVVMPDHIHFVAKLEGASIAALMHSLKSYTANEINKMLGRKGHVWERQYYERGIRDEKSLNELIVYCLENPVRKGLVNDFRDYQYLYCAYEV
jgi:REP element-mobilizing transposase RayT